MPYNEYELTGHDFRGRTFTGQYLSQILKRAGSFVGSLEVEGEFTPVESLELRWLSPFDYDQDGWELIVFYDGGSLAHSDVPLSDWERALLDGEVPA